MLNSDDPLPKYCLLIIESARGDLIRDHLRAEVFGAIGQPWALCEARWLQAKQTRSQQSELEALMAQLLSIQYGLE